MAKGYITTITTHASACKAARAAALAGRQGVTVKREGSGWVAVCWTDADRSYVNADIREGGRVDDETGRWVAKDRVYGGGLSRERMTTEAQQDLDVQTRVLAAIEAAEGELSDREKRFAQTLNADSLGKRTRHVQHFESWYAAREFARSLEVKGIPARNIVRDQNVVEWVDYVGFASGSQVREAIESGRLATRVRKDAVETGRVVEVSLGRREMVFQTVKLAQWHARKLRADGARNVKQTGFTVRWDG